MALRTILVVGILILFYSCAQVGTLTGGDKDRTAPIPVSNKMKPLHEATYFQGNEIIIPFSEFIKADKPSETMVLIPPHASPKIKIHGKTAIIHWSGKLEDNTTYILSLNGTIKDITEGNDSLMQFVFSTGAMLDSLNYEVRVVDAYTNQPVKNCLVGLYATQTDSVKPTYFKKTNATGLANFNYLKQGTYTVLAFEDKNSDLLLQADEKLAFQIQNIRLDSSLIDTLPMRLYAPKKKPKVRSFLFEAPGTFIVGANCSLLNTQFFLNDKAVEKTRIMYHQEDSLSILWNPEDTLDFQLVVNGETLKDTLSLHIQQRDKGKKLKVVSLVESTQLFPTDTLAYFFTDEIYKIDTSLFQLTNTLDSLPIPFEIIHSKLNIVQIAFAKKEWSSIELKILPKAVSTSLSFLKDTIQQVFQLKSENDFGAIKLDASDYVEPILLEVLSHGKMIRTQKLYTSKTTLIEKLLPGEYTFRIILDTNQNGRWDTGNRNSKIFPEVIHTFSEVTKVRANWEVELKLSKKQ
jgi:uncharacterized protein (DUF2141 family)